MSDQAHALSHGGEHDPHFLAAANAAFEDALLGLPVEHWFALTPLLAPGPEGKPVLVFMVAIWRKSPFLGSTINSCEPVADFMHLLDPDVVESFVTKVVGLLAQAYARQLAQASKP